MTEELVDIMSRFDLNSKEKGDSEVKLEEMEEGLKVCKLSLIGKIVGEKVANYIGVKNYVQGAWSNTKKIKVIELGVNFY